MLQLGASYLSLQAPVTPLHYTRKIWCAHGAPGEDGQLGHGDAEDHHLPRIVSAHNTMKSHPLHLVLIIALLTDTPRKMLTVGAGSHHHHAPFSQLGFHLANWFIAFSFGFLLFGHG